MRVLILTNSFPSPREPDQGPFMLRRLDVLRERGCEFRVVAPIPRLPWPGGLLPGYREMAASLRATPAEEDYGGFRVHHPRYWKLPGALDFGLFGPLYRRGVRELVRRLYREPGFDLIHAMSLVPDGYAAARLGRELGVPAVATERGYLPTVATGPQRRAARWAIENLDQCVFVCRSLAELAGSIGRPRREPRVVYTGLDEERFQPADRAAARQKLGLPAGAPLLLFVGRDVVKKGLLVLFEAMPRVLAARPAAVLCVIGSGGATPEIRAAAQRTEAGDRVRLLGARPNEELPAWYAASDVVLLPSFREGLPNNLVEAAACARPIVATNVDGIPEVVLDGETGLLVPKGDAAALAAAIGRLLDDPELARRMGEAGRRHVLARFSWKKHADEMISVYESVLSGRPEGPEELAHAGRSARRSARPAPPAAAESARS
jgi:glycosyltransferase involved in cell wall biosynthesis